MTDTGYMWQDANGEWMSWDTADTEEPMEVIGTIYGGVPNIDDIEEDEEAELAADTAPHAWEIRLDASGVPQIKQLR